jgi:hypothetical protein
MAILGTYELEDREAGTPNNGMSDKDHADDERLPLAICKISRINLADS